MAAGDTLYGHVVLVHQGEAVRLAPGDKVPEWAADRITNPKLLQDPDAEEEVSDEEAPSGDEGTGEETGGSEEGETPSDDSEAADDYDEWTNDQLRDELDARDLVKSGKQAELIARLREDDASE